MTEINYQNEGLRFRYFLPSVNKRGWGVVYALYQLGEKRERVSTRIKVKGACWNNGGVEVSSSKLRSERILLKRAKERLDEIREEVDNIFADSLNISSVDTFKLIEDIKNTINPMSKKTKQPQSIISMLRQTVEETLPNEKTKNNQLKYVRKFERFLREKGLADEVSIMNQQTIISYRDWLVSVGATSTAKDVLSNLFTLLKKVERKYNLTFGIERDKVERISDNRTGEDKRGNYVALTLEDIEKLKGVEVSGKELIVRDLFLLQCFTSVRFEDISELLNVANHRDIKGVRYCVFKSQKTKITYHIPLNDERLFPETITLVEKYENFIDIPKSYNALLKRISKRAGLDTVFKHTIEKNGKLIVTEKKVYEKISSHWGRHTLITNLVRYKGMSAKEIKYISGHSDEKMIDSVYTNTTVEDNVNIISRGLSKGSERVEKRSENYDISGITEAKSVMKFLGIEFDDEVSFDDAISKIAYKQFELIEEFGVNVKILKDLFNLTLPLHKRVEALRGVLEALRG